MHARQTVPGLTCTEKVWLPPFVVWKRPFEWQFATITLLLELPRPIHYLQSCLVLSQHPSHGSLRRITRKLQLKKQIIKFSVARQTNKLGIHHRNIVAEKLCRIHLAQASILVCVVPKQIIVSIAKLLIVMKPKTSWNTGKFKTNCNPGAGHMYRIVCHPS